MNYIYISRPVFMCCGVLLDNDEGYKMQMHTIHGGHFNP